jgi:excinuclease ABC subunit C
MLKERLRNVPLKPGVYIYKDSETGRVIYVGKAKITAYPYALLFSIPSKNAPQSRA